MNLTAKITSFFLSAAAFLCLAACEYRSPDPIPEVSGSPSVDSASTRIALITSGGTVTDESFNQSAWDSIQSYARAHGLHADFYQPPSSTDEFRLHSIQQAIKEDADIIITPGVPFGQILKTLPAKNPDIKFIAIDVDPSADMSGVPLTPNLYCITFAEEQSGFLAGYGAVKEGYTSLGFLGGDAIPSVVRYGQGFLQGIDAAARELQSPVEVKYHYAGQFSGNAEISRHMADWYRDGTEVIFSCGGAIWRSPVEAAMYYNGMVIGVDTDQHHLGDDVSRYAYNPFVTSATKSISEAVTNALELTCSDNFEQIGGTWDVMDLSAGDYVGLPTDGDSWCFQHFSLRAYEHQCDRIARGEIVVDNNCAPDFRFPTSEFTTVYYDA